MPRTVGVPESRSGWTLVTNHARVPAANPAEAGLPVASPLSPLVQDETDRARRPREPPRPADGDVPAWIRVGRHGRARGQWAGGWSPGPCREGARGVGERSVVSSPGSRRVSAAPTMSGSGVPTASSSLFA